MTEDKTSPSAVPTKVSAFLPKLNWKSALGEFLLIVIGVLVALAVNNWNADRQDRRAEVSILQQIRSSLAIDLSNLKEANAGVASRQHRMEALRDHLDRRAPYTESLPAEFGLVLGIWPLQFNRSPYDVLKAKGLALISNDGLRLRLVRVYDQVFADYQASQEDDRNVVFEVVRPHFLRAFRDIRFRETATPISYDEIVRDPYFHNVLDYRLRSLEVNCVDPAATAIKEVSGLLEDLDREISLRQ